MCVRSSREVFRAASVFAAFYLPSAFVSSWRWSKPAHLCHLYILFHRVSSCLSRPVCPPLSTTSSCKSVCGSATRRCSFSATAKNILFASKPRFLLFEQPARKKTNQLTVRKISITLLLWSKLLCHPLAEQQVAGPYSSVSLFSSLYAVRSFFSHLPGNKNTPTSASALVEQESIARDS